MRRVATAVLIGALWVMSVSPASAQWASPVGTYDEVIVELGAFSGNAPDPAEAPGGVEGAPEAQLWVVVQCPRDMWDDGRPIGAAVVQLGDPPDVDVMRRVAEQAIALPVPAPEFSPRAENRQLLGLETWIWVDPVDTAPITATACVGPGDYACVSVTAVFVDVAADMGDGSDTVVCDGPGREYLFDVAPERQRDLPHCGYLYIDSPEDGNVYDVVVAATWRVSLPAPQTQSPSRSWTYKPSPPTSKRRGQTPSLAC